VGVEECAAGGVWERGMLQRDCSSKGDMQITKVGCLVVDRVVRLNYSPNEVKSLS